MKKTLMVVMLGAGAAMAYAMRKEVRRYVAIKRSSGNPSVVGQSITPQGNERALGASAEQRRRDRETTSNLLTPEQMPNLQPGDQAG